MNHAKIVVFLILAILLLPSCMTTSTQVGNFRESQGNVFTYSRGKQCYLFWGLIPLGRTSINTPSSGNCEIRTSFRFIDAFVSLITGGIFSMQTIRVKAKHEPDIEQNTTLKDKHMYDSNKN